MSMRYFNPDTPNMYEVQRIWTLNHGYNVHTWQDLVMHHIPSVTDPRVADIILCTTSWPTASIFMIEWELRDIAEDLRAKEERRRFDGEQAVSD